MVTRIGPKTSKRLHLKKWREKAKLTQEELAERIKGNKSTISRWESGDTKGPKDRRAPTDAGIAALAEALGIEKSDLFRDPDLPSIDALLQLIPEARQREIVEVVKILIKQAS